MERLRENAPVLVTAVLALLLLAYVFAGGGSKERPDRLARCSSTQALDLLKAGLFRQAAALRRSNDPEFQQLAGYSVLRSTSQIRRDADDESATVTCSGTLALDLPPGVEVVGGRRTLSADLTYGLAGGETGALQLKSLSNADAITVPLATVTTAGSMTGQPLAPTAQAAPQEAQTAGVVPPIAAERAPPAAPVRTVEARPTPPRPAPPRTAAPPQRRTAPATTVQNRRTAPTPATTQARTAPPPVRTAPPAANAGVRPSFNCRYARSYGEVAVCSDAGLASLDRQMAAQFYRALAGASPGARTMLQRSRNRFLRARDSCRSHACVAAAYRQRIGEINGIVNGGF